MDGHRGVLRRVARALLEWLEIADDSGSRDPRDAIEAMLEALDRKGDVAALAMTNADGLRAQLEQAVVDCDSLRNQAAAFLRDGRDLMARRSMALHLEKKKEMEMLAARYRDAQDEAEAMV